MSLKFRPGNFRHLLKGHIQAVTFQLTAHTIKTAHSTYDQKGLVLLLKQRRSFAAQVDEAGRSMALTLSFQGPPQKRRSGRRSLDGGSIPADLHKHNVGRRSDSAGAQKLLTLYYTNLYVLLIFTLAARRAGGERSLYLMH